ncbi:MAG: redox-regulated ATPase YchF [Phycisphaeraceae bacterium]|nr:redox-regulated ATPase YchF [Phycisphaeraceae bacterium]
MEAGIIGLSYIGKTTLFNALTALGVGTAAGAKPNIGMVKVPDPRLELIRQFIETQKIVPADIQLVDVAGLVSGSSQGQGAGNKFLAHLRNVDALLHVVRCFDDPNVPHIHGAVDPVRDLEEVETELTLADLEVIENSIKNAERRARTGEKEAKARLTLLQQCADALSRGTPISALELSAENRHELKSFALLTAKPVLYVANVADNDPEGKSPLAQKLQTYAQGRGLTVVPICAKLEAELSELEPAERMEMLQGLGLAEPALNVLARAAYKVLGLQSFFTAGPKEIRAWTIRIGAPAPEAAGVIHSDIQRGFIRAEIYSVDDLQKFKTEAAIKHAGKMRVEGKDYLMRDGDVCHFLFNV